MGEWAGLGEADGGLESRVEHAWAFGGALSGVILFEVHIHRLYSL